MQHAILVLAALGLANSAIAATVNVSPGQSIQSAINGASNGDEIVVAPGTYHEAIDFAGKAITLRSSGGPDVTTIDASGLLSSVVTCENGEGTDTVLDGFTLTGGEGSPFLTKRVGGGMFSSWAEPTIINCTFLQNNADEGGGMWNRGKDPTLIDCRFIGNTTLAGIGVGGGGLFNQLADLMLINCTFSGNNSANYGGAIYSSTSNPTLINCVLDGNTANLGAALYLSADNLTLVNCTIADNSADAWGGAAVLASTNATISNCILWNNAPDEILAGSGIATISHSDIMGGWSGPGTTNSDTDPMFVDPASGDYRLGASSPCVDAGDNAAVPTGVDTDLDGNPRVVAMVDLGPFESQVQSGNPCVWDSDGDGTVGFGDLAALLNAWGTSDGSDGDGTVGLADLTTLLANWGSCS